MTTNQTAAPASRGSLRDDRYRLVQVILFTTGAVLMPSGVIAVGLGWYGAAHAHYAYDQFPYLLSGGLLGVCLTTLGGFLYFGAWQAKAAADQRDSLKQLADSMRVLADAVGRESGAGALDPDTLVVAGEGGAAVHRRDCQLIANRSDLRPVVGTEPGLTTCRVCQPNP